MQRMYLHAMDVVRQGSEKNPAKKPGEKPGK
jgi:hypothetical protein